MMNIYNIKPAINIIFSIANFYAKTHIKFFYLFIICFFKTIINTIKLIFRYIRHINFIMLKI